MTGQLIQGIPITDLAAEFGTPLYVYDGDALSQGYLRLRDRLHPALEIFYSLKANPNIAVCALLHSLGARAEVSSLAELVTATRAGVPARDILFVGPGKSAEELSACLRAGVYAVICESFGELALLDELAAATGVRASVALRVNPDFATKGTGLTMGGKPRQFGIDVDQLLSAPDLTARFPHLAIRGVQAYLGTRILTEDVVISNTTRILELAERLAGQLGFPLELVDVGGGLGVAYFDGERDLDIDALTDGLNPVINAFAARHPDTRLVMELGRFLAAPAGIYVVRVRYVKASMGEQFAVTDGGTHHHMAAVGIGSFVKRNFPMLLLDRPDAPAEGTWHVTGPLCTPNDTLGKKVALPDPRVGELIGVLRSGAYGPSASPVLFLSHGHPAEVLVHHGRAHLVRRRDTVEDLLAAQRLPDLSARPAGTAVPAGH